MVKSLVTKGMSSAELKEIQENLKKANYKEIRRFRASFEPNRMWFHSRKEGV